MPKTLIQQKPTFEKKVEGNKKLAIAEMFCDTIQGEGITAGKLATFIRLQGCTLLCKWCDTLDVWPEGNEYGFIELLKLFEENDLRRKFLAREQHLVLTGGSPLKQQDRLIEFLDLFGTLYGFYPYIEVENEAVLKPKFRLTQIVSQWNNSPKLSNSGMKERVRIKPDVLKYTAGLNNSWFKFVVSSKEDWNEIEKDFLPHISLEQVILMPEGQTQDELNKKREFVADLAISKGVRFSDRLQVTIWNKKTGV